MTIRCSGLILLLSISPTFAAETIFSGDSQVFTQLVDGDVWKTTFTLLNLGTGVGSYKLTFRGDDGKLLAFDTNRGHNSVFSGTIPSGGSTVIETLATSPTLLQG